VLQAENIPDLVAELTRLIALIPDGRVTTYGALATAMGCPNAARWVGEVMVDHDHDSDCQCFKVVRQTGEPGLYITGDSHRKQSLLQASGIAISGGRVDLGKYRFDSFQSTRPFTTLLEYQESIPNRFENESLRATPNRAGGVDVSYTDTQAIAAFAVVNTSTGKLVDAETLKRPIPMDYIPGFLVFREGPVLLELLRRMQRQSRLPEVVLVDGNGRLHPRRSGIATCLGVELGIRTVGVGKSLLCGKVDLQTLTAGEKRPVVEQGETIGYAIKASDRSRPIYISPGHRMTNNDSVKLCERLFHGHRIPEPVYHADRISRLAKNN
jgi:deoxyribonuclease V